MIAIPEVGTEVGRFVAELDRSRVWRVDWCVGLDVPEYQDPEVARSEGMPNIPLPPGSLIFFSFLDGDAWLTTTGVRFDRSLAAKRRIVSHRPLYVGDVVSGIAALSDVSVREKDDSVSVRVTISTLYECDGELAVEEHVTYVTRHPRTEDG